MAGGGGGAAWREKARRSENLARACKASRLLCVRWSGKYKQMSRKRVGRINGERDDRGQGQKARGLQFSIYLRKGSKSLGAFKCWVLYTRIIYIL